ncbi:MAG: HlyD family secretion protein [Planctomycetes bacterium]|nr:HlyD family secretion protein [Planctomycetota bacterium]
MIGSAIYKIDDTMKFSNVPVTPNREAVSLPAEAYIESVAVKDGDMVKKGQTLMVVKTSTASVALARAVESMEPALQALRATQGDAAAEKSMSDSLQLTKALLEKEPSITIEAPVDGMVSTDATEPLQSLAGKVASGRIGSVYNYDSLRFPVPVTGDNALRVRINLLAEQDVLDWKALTRIIKSDKPPEQPALRRIWEMLQGKLEDVKPGKVPLKRSMPEIVGALNDLLRKTDFADMVVGSGVNLPPEALQLLKRGPTNLTTDELVRLNRLALRQLMPEAIGVSENKYQAVKARLYIPQQEKTPSGKIIKKKPLVFPTTGVVVREPNAGQVVVDLPKPPAEIVDYMKLQRGNAELPGVIVSGSVVVGRISLFSFLFK